MLLSYLEGSAVAVYSAITVGIYPVGFALLLGANDFQIGLLGAFSFLATVFGFAAALIVEATGARKLTTILTGFLGRIFWLFAAPLPFLHLDTGWKVGFFLAIAALSTVGGAMSGNAWLAWFTEIVPQSIRGSYFGKRFGVVTAVNLLAALCIGAFLDLYKSWHAEAEAYAILSVIAAVFALASLLLLIFHHEGPKPQAKGVAKGVEALIKPLKDKGFLILLAYFVAWSFTNGIASPFWAAHMFSFLSMSYIQVSIYTGVAGVFVLAFQWLWGWIMDRTGARAVLKVCAFGIIFTPLLWPFASPHNYLPIWMDAAMSGFFWPGANLAIIYLLMENKGESGDSVFATFYFVTGLAGFLAGLFGAFVTKALGGLKFSWHGMFFNNFMVLFLLTSLLRIVMWLFMPHFSETNKAKASHVPKAVMAAALAGVNRLFRPRPKP